MPMHRLFFSTPMLFSLLLSALGAAAQSPSPTSAPAASAAVQRSQYAGGYNIPTSGYETPYTNIASFGFKHSKDSPHMQRLYAIGGGLDALDGRSVNNYSESRSTRPNQHKASEWFQKAQAIPIYTLTDRATAGYIGWRFLGQGEPEVKPDAAEAEYWLQVAACDPPMPQRQVRCVPDWNAVYNLGLARLRGDLLHGDAAAGLKLLNDAADAHNAAATSLLATLYQEGTLVPRDAARAQQLAQASGAYGEQEQDARRQRDQEIRRIESENASRAAQLHAESHAALMGALTEGLNNVTQTLTQPNPIQQTLDAGLQRTAAISAGAPARSTATASPVAASGTGSAHVCPNGRYFDDAAHCDCRINSAHASYSCPGGSGSGEPTLAASHAPELPVPAPSIPVDAPPAPASAVSTPATPAPASPEPRTTDPLPNCVRSWYPSTTGGGLVRNYLYFQNQCNVGLSLAWYVGNGPGMSGEVQPGNNQPSNYSAGEVREAGGVYHLFVCPQHFIPATTDGSPMSGNVHTYTCKAVPW